MTATAIETRDLLAEVNYATKLLRRLTTVRSGSRTVGVVGSADDAEVKRELDALPDIVWRVVYQRNPAE